LKYIGSRARVERIFLLVLLPIISRMESDLSTDDKDAKEVLLVT
jgi:hypothetical protein